MALPGGPSIRLHQLHGDHATGRVRIGLVKSQRDVNTDAGLKVAFQSRGLDADRYSKWRWSPCLPSKGSEGPLSQVADPLIKSSDPYQTQQNHGDLNLPEVDDQG